MRMGRIKTQMVKRLTHKLIDKHGEQFTEDFSKNKELVASQLTGGSKKIINIISGYVTRLMRMKRIKELA